MYFTYKYNLFQVSMFFKFFFAFFLKQSAYIILVLNKELLSSLDNLLEIKYAKNLEMISLNLLEHFCILQMN